MGSRHQKFDPRQYMCRSQFEVFHSLDPEPSDIAIHHHDFYEVYFFLSGKVEYRVEGRIYQLRAGDLLLISPMELHQMIVKESSAAYDRFVLWIDREYLEGFTNGGDSLTRCFDTTQSNHTNLLRLTPSQRADIMMRFEMLVQENYGEEYARDVGAIGNLLLLMVKLNRIALQRNKPRLSGEGDIVESPLVTQVLDYVNDHYDENLSLEGLAQKFYVSKYHLSHEFSRVVGTSVYRYITMKRLLIAKQMLSSGISPGTAYINCGFSDYANFYRAFKAQYGINPRDCMSTG